MKNLNITKVALNHSATAFAALVFAGIALLSTQAGAQVASTVAAGNSRTIITVVPKNDKEGSPTVAASNLSVKVDGKSTPVTGLRHYGDNKTSLELVLLVDDSARSSLGLYLKEMSNFLTSLPPTAAVAVAYIENGSAHFTQQFTLDHAAAASTLHLPGSPGGANADPYFALTALADGWPSRNPGVRREVVMISDGVDPYYGLRYDPQNPYVSKATAEAQKHGILVYSIYYKDRGRADRFGAAIDSGQNYLIQLSQATGGQLYYQGFSNPVSFEPFFAQISRNLMNQYEVGLNVPSNVKDGLQNLKIKVEVPNTRTTSPEQIFVGEPGESK